MTFEEFEDAVPRGQGRAVLALRGGEVDVDPHRLRRLLLRWRGLDAQCEEPRGVYVADLILASGHSEYLRLWLFRLLRKGKSQWANYVHRSDAVRALALAGDKEARAALYSHFASGGDETYLAEEIVKVDGLRGLRWILDFSSLALTHERAVDLRLWREQAEKVDGQEAVDAFFRAEPLLLDLSEWEPERAAKRVSRVSFEEFKRSWIEVPRTAPINAIEWSKTATRDDLRLAARELEVATNKGFLLRLMAALRGNFDLIDVPAVIDRARYWLGDGGNPYISVLRKLASPAVRDFGLDLLSRDNLDGVDLLERNATLEDLPLVKRLLPKLEGVDDFALHGVVLSLLAIGERLSCLDFLHWIAEESPCSFCRESAVCRLIEVGDFTSDQLREWEWDCVSEIRDMARAVSGRR